MVKNILNLKGENIMQALQNKISILLISSLLLCSACSSTDCYYGGEYLPKPYLVDEQGKTVLDTTGKPMKNPEYDKIMKCR